MHRRHVYLIRFRARIGEGLAHRALDGGRLECGPGFHHEHIECVVVLADLPATGINEVEHLMENHGMHRDRSLFGRG